MIDPTKLPNYTFTDNQLEEFMLFCVLVAGKNATTTAMLLDNFLKSYCYVQPGVTSPFSALKQAVELDTKQDRYGANSKTATLAAALRHYGFGCYNLKASAIIGLLDMSDTYVSLSFNKGRHPLRCLSCSALIDINGIGNKTARYFILHTRKGAEVACLDVHILRYMREEMMVDAPIRSPSCPFRYRNLERMFLEHAKALNVTPAELDISIWKRYSGRDK